MEEEQVVMEKEIMELENKNKEWERRFDHLSVQLRNEIKLRERIQ